MSLREGWNFHNDVAARLERVARSHFGFADRPFGTKFDADEIEGGSFAEVMVLLLKDKYKNIENDEANAFIVRCESDLGKKAYEMDKQHAHDMITEFAKLYKG